MLQKELLPVAFFQQEMQFFFAPGFPLQSGLENGVSSAFGFSFKFNTKHVIARNEATRFAKSNFPSIIIQIGSFLAMSKARIKNPRKPVKIRDIRVPINTMPK